MRRSAGFIAAVLLFAAGWAFGRILPRQNPSPLTCYFVSQGDIKPLQATLTTQFDTQDATLVRVQYLCLPATKTLPPPKKPAPVKKGDHLVCYEASGHVPPRDRVLVTDQFAQRRLRLPYGVQRLCEPADKTQLPGPPSRLRKETP